MNRLLKTALTSAAATILGISLLGCSAAPGAAAASPAAEMDSTAESSSSQSSGATDGKSRPGSTDASGSAGSGTAASVAAPDKTDLKNKDLTDTWDAGSAQITLSGSTAQSDAAGVSVNGSVVTITTEGTYVLAGTLDNGCIVIDAADSDDVQVVLNGAHITNESGPAILAQNADKTILTIAADTTNSAADGAVYADTSDDAPNAAIYADCDLSINGKGILDVTGSCNNGIGTKDDLKIADGTINVTAVNNALKGKDSVQIAGGTFNLEAGGDAIQSDKDDDAAKGFVVIDDGSFTISAANDAVQAETGITINGGTFDVTTNEGADNAGEKTHGTDFGGGFTRPEMGEGFGGSRPMPPEMNGTFDGGHGRPDRDGTSADGTADGAFGGRSHGRHGRISETAEGEAEAAPEVQPVNVRLAAGENEGAEEAGSAPGTADSAAPAAAASEDAAERRGSRPKSSAGPDADASAGAENPSHPADSAGASSSDSSKGLKANGILTVNGGTFRLNCADDAIHSNGSINLNGGAFTISSGDDAVHADGDLRVRTDVQIEKSYEGLEGGNIYIEDGNIAITSSDDAVNAARDDRTANCVIEVTGGTVKAVAGGDGFDSNGDIKVSGGDITMLIRSSMDNCAFDAEQTFTVTGGNLIYGGTGTGAGPGNGSSQSYVYAQQDFSAGTEVSVRAHDKTLISFVPDIDCNSLAFSVPAIKSGETYDVYAGDVLVATAVAGRGSSGMAGGIGGMRPNQETADGSAPDGFDGGTPPQRPGDGSAPDGVTSPTMDGTPS